MGGAPLCGLSCVKGSRLRSTSVRDECSFGIVPSHVSRTLLEDTKPKERLFLPAKGFDRLKSESCNRLEGKSSFSDIEAKSLIDEEDAPVAEEEGSFFFTGGDEHLNQYPTHQDALVAVKDELRQYQKRLMATADLTAAELARTQQEATKVLSDVEQISLGQISFEWTWDTEFQNASLPFENPKRDIAVLERRISKCFEDLAPSAKMAQNPKKLGSKHASMSVSSLGGASSFDEDEDFEDDLLESSMQSFGTSSAHVASLMAQLRKQWEGWQQYFGQPGGEEKKKEIEKEILSSAVTAGRIDGVTAVARSAEKWHFSNNESILPALKIPETSRDKQDDDLELSEVSDLDGSPILKGNSKAAPETIPQQSFAALPKIPGRHTSDSRDSWDTEMKSTPLGSKSVGPVWSDAFASARESECSLSSNCFYIPAPVSPDRSTATGARKPSILKIGSFNEAKDSTEFAQFMSETRRLVFDKEIGAGATCDVWRARLTGGELPDEVVAVKKLKRNCGSSGVVDVHSEEFKRVFKMEVSILRKLSHQHIIKYRGVQVSQPRGELNLVLEFCEGGSLKTIIDNNGPFALEPLLDVSCQILQGLDYLHQNGIIHRDVKPSNILMRNNVIKIADFDVSTQLFALQSLVRTAVGTPHYMAPEVVNCEPYSATADIWSFGGTILELASGERPFGRINGFQAMIRLSQGQIPSLEFFQGKDKKLCQILAPLLMECWKLQASDRPTPNQLLSNEIFSQIKL